MPGGDGESQFYSYNVGAAHLIPYSNEFYYFVDEGWTQIPTQYRWLEDDLLTANRPENRALHPWIIGNATCLDIREFLNGLFN